MEEGKDYFKAVDLASIHREEKKFVALEMHDLGYTFDQIQKLLDYSPEALKKTILNYGNHKLLKEFNPDFYFEGCFETQGCMFSDDEMNYGRRGNNKYSYEVLSPAEKRIYRKIMHEDIKAKARAETKRKQRNLKNK